jgi:hypothetical protein
MSPKEVDNYYYTMLNNLNGNVITPSPSPPLSYAIVKVKQNRSKKSKSSKNSSTSPRSPSASASTSVVLPSSKILPSLSELSTKYINYYANAVNTDYTQFAENMKTILTSNVQIELFSCNRPSKPEQFANRPLNYWGNFTHVSLTLPQLINTVSKIQECSPNVMLCLNAVDSLTNNYEQEERGIIHPADYDGKSLPRSRRRQRSGEDEEDNSDEDDENGGNDKSLLFRGKFSYAGTVICRNSLDNGSPSSPSSTSSSVGYGPYTEDSWREFLVNGTIVMHRSQKAGKIYKIEFYYEYIK